MAGARRPILLAVLVSAAALAGGCRMSVNHYLLQARKGDVAAQREAVIELADLLSEKESVGVAFDDGDRQALEFMTAVALESRDLTSRLYALKGLARIQSVDHTDVFLSTLDDESWGVRWDAVKALKSRQKPRAAEPLAARLPVEPDPVVRLEIIQALGRLGNRVALKSLLEAFLDGTGRYRDNRLKLHAHVARLSGRDYAFEDYNSWSAYHAEEFGTPAGSDEGDEKAGSGP